MSFKWSQRLPRQMARMGFSRASRRFALRMSAAYISVPQERLEFRLIRLALIFALTFISGAAFAETAPKVAPQSPNQVRLSFAPVVKKVTPAVVNVYASRVETAARNPLFDDPIFRRFFGGEGDDSRVSKALGSGVIVDPSGLIVTNYHVIENMTQVKVALSDR